MAGEPKCGFCGILYKETFKLIRGISNDHYICQSCVEDCTDMFDEYVDETVKDPKAKKKGKIDSPTPKEIVEHLDKYVVGQERAKKIIAVSVYNHYKRLGKKSTSEITKSNILLLGPTGSGKTLIAETMARFLEVPFAASDATTITSAGYVGEDVDSVLVRLIQNASGDIKKAQTGIIYIDEIDKIATRDTKSKDVNGEGVQQALLKMLEGSLVAVNPQGRKNASAPTENIDTTNILFICGGAFSGLTDTTQRKRGLGLNAVDRVEEQKLLRPKDLVRYGMIPEFIGRFPLLAQLAPLSVEDLIKILTEPKNAITKQYTELLADDGVKLTFSLEFLRKVAERAKEEGTGARGLKAIIEPALLELMFKSPDEGSTEILVTPDFIESK